MESGLLLRRALLRKLKPQAEKKKKKIEKDLMKNYILVKNFFPRGRRKEREKKPLREMILLIQSPRLFKWEERIFHLGPRVTKKEGCCV